MDRSTARGRLGIALMLALALVTLAGVLVGCGSSSSSSADGEGDATELRMGIEPWIGYGPWWIADAKGFDRDHGVDLKLTMFKADAEMDAAFASDRLDAESALTETALNFLADGVPLKIVLLEDISQTADGIIAGPDVDSVEELAGKSVAFELGAGGSNLMVDFPLYSAGMSREDIDHVELPAAEAGTALLAGRVDAAETYEPYLSEALNKGKDKGLHIIFKAGDNPGMVSDVLGVNETYAEENREAVVAALEAWDDAIAFYRSHTAEAQEIIAEKIGADPVSLEPAFEGIELFDVEQSQKALESTYPPLAEEILTTLQKCCEFEGEPALDQAIDTSFGAEVLDGGK